MAGIPTREDALALLKEFNSDPSLINHALAVEGVMRHCARKHGEDEEPWGIVGLIHDLDYERFPDQHCVKTKEILVEPRSLLEKTLYAIDELTGLIAACAYVRPSKSVMDLEVKSVRKKWKQKSFAAGADRAVIARGAELLGVELDEIIQDTITGMREVAGDIGL